MSIFCLDGGLLVGMGDRLPADGPDVYRTKGQIVGCSRVFCALCRTWVKHVDGHRIWSEQLSRVEHERFYETLDLVQFAVLRADSDADGFRTYLCRCSWADTPGIKRLGYGDIDGWSCAGHPDG